MKKVTLLVIGAVMVVSLFSIPKIGLSKEVSDVSFSEIKSEKSIRTLKTGLWGTAPWEFDDSTGILTVGSGVLGKSPWNDANSPISAKLIKEIVFSEQVTAPVDSSYLFSSSLGDYKLENVTSIRNLNYLDTSNTTKMEGMFSDMASISNLDVSSFNTIKVTNMSKMFEGLKNISKLNVTGLNTSNVTDMSFMFNARKGNTDLKTIDTSNFDTSKVTDMSSMFAGLIGLTDLDLKSFNTSRVTTMDSMFYGDMSLSFIDVSSFDTSSVRSFRYMFYMMAELEKLDVSGFNTSNATTMFAMFTGNKNLVELDVSNFDTSKVTSMDFMFRDVSKIINLDVSKFNTSNVTSMESMFYNIKVSNLDVSKFNTSNVTNMSGLFAYCSELTSLDVSNFDTSKVIRADLMFYGLKKVQSINDLNLDFTNAKDLTGLFGQSGYTKLDLSKVVFPVSSSGLVPYGMFDGSNLIKELTLNSSFSEVAKIGVFPSDPENFNLGLAPIDTETGVYSGRWLGISESNKDITYSSSDDLMENFKPEHAGTFIWETSKASLEVKNSTIQVSDIWEPRDNFISATNAIGEAVLFDQITITGDVDTSKPGVYEVTYSHDGISKTVTITVENKPVKLKVAFVNEDGQEINSPLTLDKNVGESVDLTKETSVMDIVDLLISQGYDLNERPANETNVLVQVEPVTITYIFTGKLSFVSAPSSIDFGTQKVTSTIQRAEQPASIQGDLAVQDSRGTKGQWQLTARLDSPLTNGQKVVADALRYVYKGQEIVLDSGAQVVAKQTNPDNAVYRVNDTWSAQGDGLKLQTNVGAVLSSGAYQATIKWELTEAP